MRAAPARALSPRPTTTTAASPCPAARRAATAAEDRAPRIWHNRIGLPVVALLSARPRVASMPTAPSRLPKRARAMLIPSYAADARRLRPRRSETTWARRACRGVFGAGPQVVCAASRCALFSPPSFPPSKMLSKQREAALVASPPPPSPVNITHPPSTAPPS